MNFRSDRRKLCPQKTIKTKAKKSALEAARSPINIKYEGVILPIVEEDLPKSRYILST